MDAIDDFFFESSFSWNSSDVTVTEEEILAKQQKKANWTIQPASVKQMYVEQAKQQHANDRNSGSGSIEKEVWAE